MITTEKPLETTARDLFRAAYDNRYTWDQNFPGLVADVTVSIDGQTRTGTVRINGDLTVEVTMTDEKLTTRTSRTPSGEEKTITVDEEQEWLTNQLRDVVTHRRRKSFEDAHGKSSFTLGDADPSGAVEIMVTGDSMGSNYKVHDNQVSMVSRVMGRMAFVINHQGHLDTGEGYVSSAYSAIFRNPQSDEILRQAKFEDTYEKIGNYYVMTRQVVSSNEQGVHKTYDIQFSNIKLLA